MKCKKCKFESKERKNSPLYDPQVPFVSNRKKCQWKTERGGLKTTKCWLRGTVLIFWPFWGYVWGFSAKVLCYPWDTPPFHARRKPSKHWVFSWNIAPSRSEVILICFLLFGVDFVWESRGQGGAWNKENVKSTILNFWLVEFW